MLEGVAKAVGEPALDVSATLSTTPSTSAAPAGTAENIPKQVIEEVPEIAEIAEVATRRASAGATDPCMAKAVVAGALLGIRQNRVGFGDLLEALLGLHIVGVSIRMTLERELAIDLFEVGFGNPTVNA